MTTVQNDVVVLEELRERGSGSTEHPVCEDARLEELRDRVLHVWHGREDAVREHRSDDESDEAESECPDNLGAVCSERFGAVSRGLSHPAE